VSQQPEVLSACGEEIEIDEPIIMGIVNVTPDSFSDGGENLSSTNAVSAGVAMVAEGARIIDVGGESTRPGSDTVSEEVELFRVIPVVRGLAAEGLTVSVDTTKPVVARAAIEAGAVIVNDVSGLRDPAMIDVVAQSGAGCVIMHMQGNPRTMQTDPSYDDVVLEVSEFLRWRAESAVAGGVRPSSIVVDPGIGFGKTLDHNLQLMRGIASIADVGFPVLIGPSRKGFLGELMRPIRGSTEPEDRDAATLGAVAFAIERGARIIRVHNVAPAVEVAHVVTAMVRSRGA
jgi:dihydropteroate synthase